MTDKEKLDRLNELFNGEFKQFVEDALLYVKYKQGYDVKQTYEEVMSRGKRAYDLVQRFNECINAEDIEGEKNRIVDNIARGF
jgi:hypothetical protein